MYGESATNHHPNMHQLEGRQIFYLWMYGGDPNLGSDIWISYNGQKFQFYFKNSNFNNYNVCSTIKTLCKNYHFVEKLQFWLKITIFFKIHNFVQKLQLCSKSTSLFKNSNFVKKSQFCSKICSENFVPYNFVQKS